MKMRKRMTVMKWKKMRKNEMEMTKNINMVKGVIKRY